MARNPESLKNLRPGNKRGPAKTSVLLKDAILQAAERAGGEGGIVAYLEAQASLNPGPFMALLGKILPTQTELTGKDGGTIKTEETGQGVARLAAFIDGITERSGTAGEPAAE